MNESDLVINPRESGFHRLDLQQLFGNDHPVILEIGSGKGRFLISTATERPDVNLIGIEKALHYHRLIRDRILKRHLTNIRLINHDAFPVMRDMIPDASIAEVHIYFPDPWPRAKQQKRRIIRGEALKEMRRILVEGGSGIYVTDHQEYFDAAAPFVEAEFPNAERRGGGQAIPPVAGQAGLPDLHDPPRTNYEAKYRAEGRPIYEIRFRK